MLEKITLTLPSTCINSYEAHLFAAEFSLAFHGLFRVGELTVHSGIHNNTVFKRENLTLDPVKQLLIINIQHSKTDQVRKGTIFQLEKLEGAICPFKLVETYLSVRLRVAGPLLCHFDTSPLTRYQHESNNPATDTRTYSLQISLLATNWLLEVSLQRQMKSVEDGNPHVTNPIFAYPSFNSINPMTVFYLL